MAIGHGRALFFIGIRIPLFKKIYKPSIFFLSPGLAARGKLLRAISVLVERIALRLLAFPQLSVVRIRVAAMPDWGALGGPSREMPQNDIHGRASAVSSSLSPGINPNSYLCILFHVLIGFCQDWLDFVK